MVEEGDGWEALHAQAYGEDSWTRVQRLAWALTKRTIGYDPGDIERIEEDGEIADVGPVAREERLTRWMPAAQLLALSVWRAARSEGVLVDDVALHRPLWWLGGARHGELYADPLPEWTPALSGSWRRLQEREGMLLEPARSIATWHLRRHLEENRYLADSADGTPELPLLLGDRCRALASGPYRDGRSPRWAGAVDYAQNGIRWASDELRAGLWEPGPAARHAAAALHPSLAAMPDAPPLPEEVTEVAWIQRAVRLAHLYATIGTVQDHHGRSGELDAHPRQPFGDALAGAATALREIQPGVRELEALWHHRGTGVALWERAHLPVAVREHILALESLISALCTLCFDMIVDPDEPH